MTSSITTDMYLVQGETEDNAFPTYLGSDLTEAIRTASNLADGAPVVDAEGKEHEVYFVHLYVYTPDDPKPKVTKLWGCHEGFCTSKEAQSADNHIINPGAMVWVVGEGGPLLLQVDAVKTHGVFGQCDASPLLAHYVSPGYGAEPSHIGIDAGDCYFSYNKCVQSVTEKASK